MKAQLSLYRLLAFALLFFISPITSTRVKLRGQCCPGSCGDLDTDEEGHALPDNILEQSDGISEDGTAGIGFELECARITLEPEDDKCTTDKIDKSKGKRIAGRAGHNWELTADTTVDKVLDAEYIINGKTVKMGTGAVKQAALDVANDIVSNQFILKPMSNSQ